MLAVLLSCKTVPSASKVAAEATAQSELSSIEQTIYDSTTDCKKLPFGGYTGCSRKVIDLEPDSVSELDSRLQSFQLNFIQYFAYDFICESSRQFKNSNLVTNGMSVTIAPTKSSTPTKLKINRIYGEDFSVKISVDPGDGTILSDNCRLFVLFNFILADSRLLKILADLIFANAQLIDEQIHQIEILE